MAHFFPTSARDKPRYSITPVSDEGEHLTLAKNNGDVYPTSMIGPEPTLFHRIKNQGSILTLLVSDSKIFAGTQSGDLLVWSLETFEFLAKVHAHRGSVLCLCLSANRKLLFSSAGDAIVNVWCTSSLTRQYSIYSKYDVGDVFCVVFSTQSQTAYLGAQNTSIQVLPISRLIFGLILSFNSGMICRRRIPDLLRTQSRIRPTETIASLTLKVLLESLHLAPHHPLHFEPLGGKTLK